MYQAYPKDKVTFWESDKMFNFSMKNFKIRLQQSSLPQNIFLDQIRKGKLPHSLELSMKGHG